MAKLINSEKVLWLAMDVYPPGKYFHDNEAIFEQVKENLWLCSQNEYGEQRFDIIFMNKVLRCSENIARVGYGNGENRPNELQARLGHKIVENLPFIEHKNFSTGKAAREAIFKRAETVVSYLLDRNIDLRKFAIVVGTRDRRDNFGYWPLPHALTS